MVERLKYETIIEGYFISLSLEIEGNKVKSFEVLKVEDKFGTLHNVTEFYKKIFDFIGSGDLLKEYQQQQSDYSSWLDEQMPIYSTFNLNP